MAETRKTEVKEPKEAKAPADLDRELVDFYAFKDGDKYKDDIVVAVNGKVWRIQRGVHVKIPRYVYDVLDNSQKQDISTANLIERETAAYEKASSMLN